MRGGRFCAACPAGFAVLCCFSTRVSVSKWLASDGDRRGRLRPPSLSWKAPLARCLGERAALNLLQTLSGTATRAHHYASLVEGSGVRLLDTRRRCPGCECPRRYAVSCGGGQTHRIGLYDAFLIKENHIAACGSIAAAVREARDIASDLTCEVEVEQFRGAGTGAGCRCRRHHARQLLTIDQLIEAVARATRRMPGQPCWKPRANAQREHPGRHRRHRRGLHLDRRADQGRDGHRPVDVHLHLSRPASQYDRLVASSCWSAPVLLMPPVTPVHLH